MGNQEVSPANHVLMGFCLKEVWWKTPPVCVFLNNVHLKVVLKRYQTNQMAGKGSGFLFQFKELFLLSSSVHLVKEESFLLFPLKYWKQNS